MALVRTARRKLYRSSRRIEDLARSLPTPPLFRCHRSYLVNLDRVRSLERAGNDYLLRLDPPVNKVIPVSRRRLAAFRRLMGVE
jgi:two-component system, LytTR family, response regulator